MGRFSRINRKLFFASKYYSNYQNYKNQYYNYDNQYNDINGIKDDFILKSNGKKPPKKPSWLIVAGIVGSLAICIGGISFLVYSIVSKNNQNSGSSSITSSRYNKSSPATKWISERTLSLRFSYSVRYNNSFKTSSYYEYGTGWVYSADESTNTFYIATNLHVAGIVSLIDKNVNEYKKNTNSSFSNSNYITAHYSNLNSWVGFAQDLGGDEVNSSEIPYYKVSNPQIVYTTMMDDSFNNTFNSGNSYSYYGNIDGNFNTFKGISDIAILKYELNPNTSVSFDNYSSLKIKPISTSNAISNFKDWIKTYFENPTKVYKEDMENLPSSAKGDLSMAGYPSYNILTGQSNNDGIIAWLPFSDFDIYSTYSPVEKNDGQNSPIEYIPSNVQMNSNGTYDIRDSYYMSIGLLSELNADSYAGASGSPIVANLGTKENPDYEIVGIYWGAITYQYQDDQEKSYGTMTWFATNGSSNNFNENLLSKKYSYNLTTTIDKNIELAKNKKIE